RGADALARPLEVRLHDRRERQLVEAAALERGARDEAAARARNAPPGELLLRERLVERHAERVCVAPGRRDPELFEERGIEGAPGLAAVTLGQVEHEVGRERLEPRHEERRGARDVERLDPMTRAGERALYRGDRLWRVELGFGLALGDP